MPAGAAAPGVEFVAYELERGTTLAQAADRLAAHGVDAQEIDVPVRGRGLRLQDPAGNGVALLERVPPEDRSPAVFRRTDALLAHHPRSLRHVNYLTADDGRARRLVRRVLGFGVTDWIGDDAVWLHGNRDHHALAFLDKGYEHLRHLAFELVDCGEMRVALDHLARRGRRVAWGPRRHSMAQNLFAYGRMPKEEHFVELYCDLEQLRADHKPRRFPDDPHASNAWGVLPPRSYFRFDEEAVRSELEQREALRG